MEQRVEEEGGRGGCEPGKCGSLALFSACACTMMPLNKAVMKVFERSPLTAVAGQMLATGVAMVACCGGREEVKRKEATRTGDVVSCMALPVLFAGMLVTSMLSLPHASLGAIMAIRNTAPLMALPLEHACLEPQKVTARTVAAMAMMVGGCAAYVRHDAATTPLGAGLAMGNTVIGVVDRLAQRHLLATEKVPKETMLVVNNLVGGAIVLSMAAAGGEGPARAAGRAARSAERMAMWGGSAVVGGMLGYAGARAQSMVTATTHLVVTGMNRVVVMAIAAAWMGERPSVEAAAGGVASMIGTVLYAL
jgi:drug/metabolite transporter (DMT)-like permease